MGLGIASKVSSHVSRSPAAPYLVNLHVVQSHADWCPAPCHGPSWEMGSVKTAPGARYVLLEAAIWRQERRVALYHFDPEWQKKSRRVYHGICDGAWKCAAYREFRESKRLLEA